MRLVLFGASGQVGREVARIAAGRGHQVTAVVRPITLFRRLEGVEIRRFEPLDAAETDEAVQGHDAVICCVGQQRAGQSPWARALSPPELVERLTRILVASMERHGVRRIVMVSAGGVGDSRGALSGPVRWLVSQGRVAEAYRDLEAAEGVLAASGLDWLAVRPVTLANGAATGRARPVPRYGALSRIRRADVAEYLVSAAERTEPFREHTVLLGS